MIRSMGVFGIEVTICRPDPLRTSNGRIPRLLSSLDLRRVLYNGNPSRHGVRSVPTRFCSLLRFYVPPTLFASGTPTTPRNSGSMELVKYIITVANLAENYLLEKAGLASIICDRK